MDAGSTLAGRAARTAEGSLGPERRLRIQYEIARAFAEGEQLRDVSKPLLQTLTRELGWPTAGLWVLDASGSSLVLADVHVTSDLFASWAEGSAKLCLRVGEGLPGAVWARGEPIWIRDTHLATDFPRRDLARRVGLRHGLAFPALVQGSAVAVVEMFAARVREIDTELTEFLAAVGHQLGSFIERVEARRAVAASEERKSAILHAAVDAIVSSDAEGHITEFNAAAERLFGRRREEATGKRIAELLVPADLRPRHLRGLRRCVTTGQPRILGQRVRTRALRADGSEVPVELTVTESRYAGRSTFTAFIRDITHEIEAETARERFLEILSHELRTPLTSIYGGAQLLGRSALDSANRDELIADIRGSADRLHRLVENLIVLARAQEGTDRLTLEPVHVERVVERAVDHARMQRPDLDVTTTSNGARQAVQADETSLEQVLANLLSNAMKYGGDGPIEVSIEHGPTESTVRVLDRGLGIAGAEAERLFEIDYRSPLTEGLAHGSGIGLFVARWLVAAMGGRIWARPRPGGGSEFGLALRSIDPETGAVQSRIVGLDG